MEHLNFSRQMVKDFMERDGMSRDENLNITRRVFIDIANRSQKFILPDCGVIYDDPLMKGLDENERLNLPFPIIGIEYVRSDECLRRMNAEYVGTDRQPRKALCFAQETPMFILVYVASLDNASKTWTPYPYVAIPRTGFIERPAGAARALITIQRQINPPIHIEMDDYLGCIGSLMSMLSALNCKNVRVEKTPDSVARLRSPPKTRPGALPFDTYHMLTIDSAESGGVGTGGAAGNRSPREHLRRGHIRRLSDGRRVWVNATVVAAGRPGGVVRKDYAVHH